MQIIQFHFRQLERIFKKLTFLFLLFFSTTIKGQLNDLNLELNGGFYASSNGINPFWLRTNTWGEVPLKSNFGTIGFNLSNKKKEKKFKNQTIFDYGLSAKLNVGKSTQFIIPEGYISISKWAFKFQAGRRKEIQGLVDSTLSSGSYAVSQNALPLPKIELSIPEYTPILFKKLISIKGNFAHGWFGSTDSVKNYYLHQLSFYTRVGKPNWNSNFYVGINHQAQWGGRPAVPYMENGVLISSYGNDFKSFLNVVFGKSNNEGGNGGGPQNEEGNRSGNHLGTVDIGFDIKGDYYKTYVYRQSFYEDGSLFYLNNISDGLFGIAFSSLEKETIFQKVVLEFFNSTNQGGPIYADNPPELRGADNYYNNSIYKDGWGYKLKIIGNPFINNYKDISTNIIINDKQGLLFDAYKINNRVRATYVGLYLKFDDAIKSYTKLSYSNSKGNYSFTEINNLKQFSFGEKIIYTNPNYIIEMDLGIDSGKLWKNSVGMGLLFRKSF